MNKMKLLIGLEKGRNFFKYIKDTGKFLLFAMGYITMLIVWVFIAIYIPEFFNLSVIMLKVIRMSMLFFLIGFIFYWLLYFVCYLLEKNIIKTTLIKEEIIAYGNTRKTRRTKQTKTKYIK